MTRHLVRWILAGGLLFAAGASWAQVDCSRVPDGMRARCEEANRVNAACAGLEGEALKTCRMKNVHYGATREDCSRLEGDARAKCELHNRNAALAAPCSGKAGAELTQCIREHATKAVPQ